MVLRNNVPTINSNRAVSRVAKLANANKNRMCFLVVSRLFSNDSFTLLDSAPAIEKIVLPTRNWLSARLASTATCVLSKRNATPTTNALVVDQLVKYIVCCCCCCC
jgi:hypothetical protein